MNRQIVLGILCIVISPLSLAKTYSAYLQEDNKPKQEMIMGANASGESQSMFVDQNGNLKVAPQNPDPQQQPGQNGMLPQNSGMPDRNMNQAPSTDSTMTPPPGYGAPANQMPPQQQNNMQDNMQGGPQSMMQPSPETNNAMSPSSQINRQNTYPSTPNTMMQPRGNLQQGYSQEQKQMNNQSVNNASAMNHSAANMQSVEPEIQENISNQMSFNSSGSQINEADPEAIDVFTG